MPFWKKENVKTEVKKEPSKLYRMCEKYNRPDLYEALYDIIPTNPGGLVMNTILSNIEEKKNLDVNYRIAGFLALRDNGLKKEERLNSAKGYFEKSLEESSFPHLTIILNNLEDAYRILYDVWYLPE